MTESYEERLTANERLASLPRSHGALSQHHQPQALIEALLFATSPKRHERS